MTSVRHYGSPGPSAGAAFAQRPMSAVGQPPGSPDRHSVPSASGRMHITNRNDGTSTTVRVSGVLTEAGTRRVAAMLNTMVTVDGERTTIHLDDVSSMVWPQHHDRGGGTNQVAQVNQHPRAARARASTPSLGTSQVTGRARWPSLCLSECEQRALIEIEAGLVSSDAHYLRRFGVISRQVLLPAAQPPQSARGWHRILHLRRYRDG